MATDPIRKLAFSKAHLLQCKGYDPLFINGSTKLSCNLLSASQQKLLPAVENNPEKVLHYSHHSIYYNKKRKVPFFSASNVDGRKKLPIKKRKGRFQKDPRIDPAFQLDQKGFYDLIKGEMTEFEIGHMTAYNEMHWGKDEDQARLHGYETFFFVNSVPQAQRLNSGLWSKLESDIFARIPVSQNKKACLFTGPVLKSKDPFYTMDKTFQVPLLFWKVMVFKWKNKITATAFLMSHEKKLNEDGLLTVKAEKMAVEKKVIKPEDILNFRYRKPFQVSHALLEKITGLSFKWPGVKWIPVPQDMQQVEKIKAIDEASDLHEKFMAKKKAGSLSIILP